MCNEKIEVSKVDAPTKRWLYIGALIPKDKTMISQTPCRETQNTESKKKLHSLIKKDIRQRFICVIFIGITAFSLQCHDVSPSLTRHV